MKKRKVNVLATVPLVCGFMLLLGACGGGESSRLQETDLLPFGMPISIQAPMDTMIMGGTTGDMGDVLIQSKDTGFNYNVQIYSLPVSVNDMATIVEDEKTLVADSTFVKYLAEDPAGFVYEYNIDGVQGFDFRYFMIQGDKKYSFQTGLGAFYSQDDVEMMFKAVKRKE